jgi:hypothetical protein
VKYGIKRIAVSAYHPQANGMVERGHKPIVDALAKMMNGGEGDWVHCLPAVLLADRTTTRVSTGQTPYYLGHGMEAVLPVELKYPTWRILDWKSVRSTADLLAVWAKQILRRNEDLREAAMRLRRARTEGKESFDGTRQLRQAEIREGDLVLLHDAVREVDMSRRRKLDFRWNGPYRVCKAVHDKGTYELTELDGTKLLLTYAGNRLKKFVEWNDILMAVVDDLPLEGESESEEQEGFAEPGSANQPETSRPDTLESATTASMAGTRDARADEGVEYGRTAARLQWEEQARQHIPDGKRFAIVVGGEPMST